MMRTPWTVRTLLIALTLAVVPPPLARAKGDVAGTLAGGGRAKGDISKEAGETDRIAVDLERGAAVTITFSAGFTAHLAVSGPDGTPVDLGAVDGSPLHVRSRPVDASGSYEFVISSADGSQGLYTLAVKQRWPRTLAVPGNGRQVVDVAMPAPAKLACVVRSAPGAAGRPEIVALEDPVAAALLQAPLVATGRAVKLPRTATATAGVYHLTIDASDGTSAWTATVTRAVPPAPSTVLNLTNGLDVVSFSADGVDAVFAHHCTQCHSWAWSYAGVRANLTRLLPRIAERSMPPGGGLSARDTALIFAWVRSGKAH